MRQPGWQRYKTHGHVGAAGLPLAVHTASANLHEVTLVEAAVDAVVIVGLPV
jgi:hypothetical protein